MPCKKCEEGNYKWGETGECKYDSLDACESANHKYKMQPTPLVQKTYEEYEKELKEYNLSSAIRFEFKDVKTIEKLIGQMDALVSKLDKEFNQVDGAAFDYKKSEEARTEALKELDDVEKDYDNAREKLEIVKKELAAEEKYLVTEQKKYDKAIDKTRKTEDKLVGLNEKYKTTYDKGENLKADLKTAIKQVDAAAKALGIKNIPATTDGEAAIKSFDGQVPDAAKYFKY